MKEKLKKSMAIIIITTMLISLSSLFITKKSSAATLTTTCRNYGKWMWVYAEDAVNNIKSSEWAKENGVDITKINKGDILGFEASNGLTSFSNNKIDLTDVTNLLTVTEELKSIIAGKNEFKQGEFVYDELKKVGFNVDNMMMTSTVKADGNTYELSTLNHNYNMKELTEIFNGDYIGNNSKIEFADPVEVTIKASSEITVNVKSISFDNEKVTVVKADDNSEQTIENVKEIMVSGETTTKDFSVIKDNQKLNIVGDSKKSLLEIKYNHEDVSKEWMILYHSYVDGAVAFDDMTFNITDGNGELWYLVLATDENLYLVKADIFKNSTTSNNFATTLNYTAKIDNNDVGGTTDKDGTFSPNYNSEDIKKDADVTATIKSTNGDDIVVVNNKKLDETGKANEDGWYYPDVNDKTTIVKIYPFERYNNSTDNGIVKESVELQNKNGDKSEQNVSITWPFRIIDKTYDPDVIDKNTNEVKVTITTNLPMDPNKVPDGWTIVPDTDNHKITKTYKRGQDINEDVTVYQNGTGKTDSTTVTVKWNGETAPTILARTGESKLLIGIIAILIVVAVIIKIKRNRLK